MVGEAIEQDGCHLGIAEDARPFAEAELRFGRSSFDIEHMDVPAAPSICGTNDDRLRLAAPGC